MFGKHFASMYSGSMFGQPAIVFALWGYVIANMRPSRKDGACYIELNPTLLAATFACSAREILDAVTTLSSPDEKSRSKESDGRRIVFLGEDLCEGPMQFRVVNGSRYRAMRDEEERRVYLRDAKRKERAARKSTKSLTVNRSQPPSSQAEAEAEAEAETENGRDGKGVHEGAGDAEPRPSRSTSREPITDSTAAEIERLAGELAAITVGVPDLDIPAVPAEEWIARASRIEADAHRPAKSFRRPREPGVSEPWARTTVRKLTEFLEQARRPVL